MFTGEIVAGMRMCTICIMNGMQALRKVFGNAGIEQGTGMEKRESRPSPEGYSLR